MPGERYGRLALWVRASSSAPRERYGAQVRSLAAPRGGYGALTTLRGRYSVLATLRGRYSAYSVQALWCTSSHVMWALRWALRWTNCVNAHHTSRNRLKYN